MFVQVTSKRHRWRSSERIEVFAIASFLVDVDGNPVFTQFMRRIGVTDQQTRIIRKSICGINAVETSHSTSNGAFNVFAIHAPKS